MIVPLLCNGSHKELLYFTFSNFIREDLDLDRHLKRGFNYFQTKCFETDSNICVAICLMTEGEMCLYVCVTILLMKNGGKC